jgi:hypothetical protein
MPIIGPLNPRFRIGSFSLHMRPFCHHSEKLVFAPRKKNAPLFDPNFQVPTSCHTTINKLGHEKSAVISNKTLKILHS